MLILALIYFGQAVSFAAPLLNLLDVELYKSRRRLHIVTHQCNSSISANSDVGGIGVRGPMLLALYLHTYCMTYVYKVFATDSRCSRS